MSDPSFISRLNAFATNGAHGDFARLYLAAVFICAEHGHVTADDMRQVELMTPDRDKRIFGGALAQLARRGILIVTGETQTQQKGSNGRPIKVFALARDWRTHWLADDKLPVPNALVNLEPKSTVAASAQVSVDELFATLAEAHRLAMDGVSDPLMSPHAACNKIAYLTQRWAPGGESAPADSYMWLRLDATQAKCAHAALTEKADKRREAGKPTDVLDSMIRLLPAPATTEGGTQ